MFLKNLSVPRKLDVSISCAKEQVKPAKGLVLPVGRFGDIQAMDLNFFISPAMEAAIICIRTATLQHFFPCPFYFPVNSPYNQVFKNGNYFCLRGMRIIEEKPVRVYLI